MSASNEEETASLPFIVTLTSLEAKTQFEGEGDA
jgi:hypothetical protein